MAEQILRFKEFFKKYGNVVFFVGGFLFDALTLVRIDSVLDLAIQTFYLAAVSYLIVLTMRYELGLWQPKGKLAEWWEYESEVVHFFYGGLLSAYVIFYFKSTTLSRSVFFLGFVVLLMVANEMPQLRRAGSVMRLGLHAFCLVSFLNYLLPVIIGRMGTLVFMLAWIISAAMSYAYVRYLARLTPDPKSFAKKYGWSPALVLLLVAALYSQKLIPPVPLSMQFGGIYHAIEKENGKFRLTYLTPPWYAFWRNDDREFKARPGDQVVCFTRVFAPRRFTHQIYIHWLKKNDVTGEWQTSDRIPLNISGGRDEGFRGFAVKTNYEPGAWRVDVEVEDGRTVGGIRFNIHADDSTDERRYSEVRM